MSTSRTNPLLSLLWRIFRTVATAYFLIIALAFLFQRKLLYFPDSVKVPRPEKAEFQGIEEFQATTADGVRLEGWYWQGARPETFLIFHGNAGHRGHRLEWLSDLHALGRGVCIVDYRGYGGSQGRPSESGLHLDAEAALEWLKDRKAGKIIYLGESLGCAIALELSLKHPPAAMILQSGFLSAAGVARRAYPFLPVNLLMKDRYDLTGRIQKLACPVLVVHGAADSLVPASFGRALFDALPEPKEWLEVKGANHNDVPWVGGSSYLGRIDSFLKKHL